MPLLRFAPALRVTVLGAVARASEAGCGALRAASGANSNEREPFMKRFSPALLRASPEIKAFIKAFEILRTVAYDDGVGVWTIGYGHTKGVAPGQKITRTQAEDWFRGDIYTAEGVIRLAVKVPLAQHEYDALVSFVFNIGGGHFSGSTMRTLLNELRYEDASEEFPKWRKGGGRVLQGLVKRRAAEKLCFDQGIYPKPR